MSRASALAFSSVIDASAARVDSPPTLHASDVLPAALLKGDGFSVQESVKNDGVRNHYRVDTPEGTTEVIGTERLIIRAREMNAVVLMDATKSSKVFTDALKAAAKGPYYAVKGLITAPVDTLSSVATGVGNFLGNVGHALFGGKSEDESGVLAAAAGFDTIKRQLAFRFGVDPYSRYEPMQERLDELAWAAFGGGLPAKVAFAAIPGGAGAGLQVTSFSDGMSKLVRDKSPRELKDINNSKLERMGIEWSIRRAFLDHPKYSPTKTTKIVGALEAMEGVAGRELVLERAVLAQEEETAFRYEVQAELLAAYHHNVAPVRRILLVGENLYLQRKDGVVVGVFAADYTIWGGRSEAIFSALRAAFNEVPDVAGIELWLTGSASPLVRERLKAAGWRLHPHQRDRLRLP